MTPNQLPLARQTVDSSFRHPGSIPSGQAFWIHVLGLSLATCLWGNGIPRKAAAADSLSDNYTTAVPALEDQVLVVPNAGATPQPGEPEHWPGQRPRNSLWGTYRAPRDGVLVVDSTDSNFPTVLAVYEGKAINALTQLGRASALTTGATSEVVIGTVVAGREYDIAVDGYRGATGTVTLRIRLVTIPWIRRQPSPVTVSVDENAELSIEALGSSPTTIQWQFSPTPGADAPWFDLLGRTGSSLPLRPVNESHTGYYRARVSNRYGSVISEEAQVTVQDPPKITLQPVDARRTVGESVDFSVGAVGGKPISWRWQFRPLAAAAFVDLPGDGAAQAAFALANLSSDQAGDYRAIASNFAGAATSSVARLTIVTQGPVITEQPVGLTVIEGNPAAFRVRATGYQPIAFHWRKDAGPIPGATNSEYRLPAVSPADAGGYTVVVSNRYGAVTSGTARLVVDSRPPNDDFERREAMAAEASVRARWTNRLATLQVGEPRHVTSTATNSVWGSFIAPGRGTVTMTITSANFDTVLAVYQGDSLRSLLPVASNDDAFGTRSRVVFIAEAGVAYAVAVAGVRGAVGTFEIEVSFTDQIQPPIPNPPLPPYVEEIGGLTGLGGGCATVRLSMPTLSLDVVSYRWFRDGSLIPGETSDTLVLRNVTVESQGVYKVEARNGGGTTTSSTVLTVDLKPVIRPGGQPADVTVRPCFGAEFQVTASSCSPLSYRWRRDGVVLPGQTGRALRFASVTPAAAGGYDVVVSNDHGSITSRVAQLMVDSVPRITHQPGPDRTVKLCDSFTLDVGTDDACGTERFQWNFQDSNGSRPLLDQTNRTLRLTATAGSAGDYWVTVTTLYGKRDSGRVRVRVDSVPVVSSTQPTNQTILLGDTILLQVQAQDRCGGLVYRWQRWAAAVGGFVDVTLNARRRVRPDGFLETLSASEDDASEYRCVVGNGSASVTSRVAQITVRGRPANDRFVNALKVEGLTPTAVTIENRFASAEPGEPSHARRPARHSLWYEYATTAPCEVTIDTSGSRTLGGAALDTVLGVYQGAGLDSLREVIADDQGGSNGAARVSFLAGAGEVFYIAVDSKSADWGTVRLQISAIEIRSAPAIRVEPLDQAVTVGSRVTLSAETSGSPPLQHVWLRNGLPVGQGLMDVTRVAGIPGGMRTTLTIPQLRAGDEGLYSLVVSNALGVATSRRATVTLGVVVRGRVVDASTGEPIPGAVVRVGSEWTITDANGDYTLIIQGPDEASPDFDAVTRRVGLNQTVQFVNLSTRGTVVLSCMKTNLAGLDLFIPYLDRQFKVRRGLEITNSFPLSPILEGIRAVADWSDPDGTDLDLYCVVTGDGGVDVIYYKNPGRIDQAPYVRIELDRRGSTGPETINLAHPRPGSKYHFYVVKYDQARGSLATSSAVFRIYDRSTLVGSRSVPVTRGGEVWDLCEVDGTTRAVTWVDRVLPRIPFGGGSSSFLSSPASLSDGAPRSRPSLSAVAAPSDGVTYEWDFGDGSGVVHEFAPTHRYPAPGKYSVTLTMRYSGESGPSSRSLTKTQFIEVYNLPPTVALTSPANGTFFRAGPPIAIQASASDPDGTVRAVELLEIIGSVTNRAGIASVPPYEFQVPSALGPEVSRTNRQFFAVATDGFGAMVRSADLGISVIDLSGEALVIWSDRVPSESRLMGLLTNHGLVFDLEEGLQRPLRVVQHEQEGLRADLVRGFQVILFVDQDSAPAIRPATVEALESVWSEGTPVYLLVRDARACAGGLDSRAALKWERLTGVTSRGGRVEPGLFLRRSPVARQTELFSGAWGVVEDFEVAAPAWGFELSRAEGDRREVRGTIDGAPVLIRFPAPGLAAPFEGRTIVQSIPLEDGADPTSGEESAKLFLNAVSFLLGGGCDAFSASFDCPESEIVGAVGEELTLMVVVSNNGECEAGGVLVTNTIPSGFEIVGAECRSENDGASAGEVRRTSAGVVFGLGGLRSGESRTLVTRVRAVLGGEFTHTYSIRANGRSSAICQQRVTIVGGGCVEPRLRVIRGAVGFTLVAEGTPGCEGVLEQSTDLRSWEPVVAKPLGDGPTVMHSQPASDAAARFFRIRMR